MSKLFAFIRSLTATITIYTRNEVHSLHWVTSDPTAPRVNYHVGMYIILLLCIILRVCVTTTGVLVVGLEYIYCGPLFN